MNSLLAAFRLPLVMIKCRELLLAFVRRELKARIEGSVLGRIWPILQPAALFAIYYLVFARILKIGFSEDLAPHGTDGVGWRSTFYLISGILPWTLLAESLTRGSGVVLENANLVKKIAFPSEVLPTYAVVVNHVYFLIGYALFVALELIVNGSLPPELMWLPLIVAAQFLFVNGLTMFLSAANIFVRDVTQFTPVLVLFWMFTTPVFYDLGAVQKKLGDELNVIVKQLEAVPEVSSEYANLVAARDEKAVSLQDMTSIKSIMDVNPMSSVLDMHRSIFSYGRVPFDVGVLGRFSLVAVVVQLLGYAFFLRCKGRFADEV
jgi:lipopolysaccharide transport system permease protein